MPEATANAALILPFCGPNNSTAFQEMGPNLHVATANGNAKITTAQYKFGDSCGDFDGTGDYVSFPDHANWYFDGSFGFDLWIRPTDLTGDHGLWSQANGSGISPIMLKTDGTDLQFFASRNGSTWNVANAESVGTLSTDTWHHVAVSWDGLDYRVFLDGSLAVTVTDSNPVFNASAALAIGANDPSGAAEYWQGQIDMVRVERIAAPWTTSFTPPTEAYTPLAANTTPYNTVALLHFNGDHGDTTTTDDSNSAHTVNWNGGPSISTEYFRFGCSGFYMDGSGDYLYLNDHADFDIGSGDATIDQWVRIDDDNRDIINQWETSVPSNSNFRIVVNSSGYVDAEFAHSSTTTELYGTIDINDALWHHVALVIKGGDTAYLFVDGTLEDSTSLSGITLNTSTQALIIGAGTDRSDFYGIIDEIRFCKSAVWTTAFTPPGSSYTVEPPANKSSVAALRDRLNFQASQAGALRDRLNRTTSQVGALRDRLNRTGSRIGALRDRRVYAESQVAALRDRTAMGKSQVGALRDRRVYGRSQVAALRNRYIRDGWEIWVDGSLEGFIEDDEAAPYDLAAIGLADGTHEIEIRPSKWYWAARNLATVQAVVVSGDLVENPPPVESLSYDFVEGESEIVWTYPDGFGYATPTAFKLWFGASYPVSTAGAADATVVAKGAGVSHMARRDHTATEYLAIKSTDGSTDGALAELTLTVGSTPPPAPENVRATL